MKSLKKEYAKMLKDIRRLIGDPKKIRVSCDKYGVPKHYLENPIVVQSKELRNNLELVKKVNHG